MALSNLHQFEASSARVSFDEPIQLHTLPVLTRQNLQKIADAVVGIVPDEQESWIIRTSELRPESGPPEIVDKVRRWADRGAKFLYYLQVIGQPDFDAIRKAYSDSRNRDKGKRAYARFIKRPLPPATEKPSTCLYVGSSSNISLRLKEHLGFGASSTFSLQLAHWARGLHLELQFICAKYGGLATPDVYQALEDTLWDLAQPMFGRKGRR